MWLMYKRDESKLCNSAELLALPFLWQIVLQSYFFFDTFVIAEMTSRTLAELNTIHKGSTKSY